jgi:hypothetical protein
MRPLLKYGIPLAGALTTAGYAASQGEDPGSAVLAGLAGGAGAAGGLLAARKLAGKYAPDIYKAGLSAKQGFDIDIINELVQAENRAQMEGVPIDPATKLKAKVLEKSAAMSEKIPGPEQFQRGLGKVLAGGLVPASALVAGLGGVAAGAIPGAMGVPGFNQNVITDPELAGSSNTPMARASTPTLRYIS